MEVAFRCSAAAPIGGLMPATVVRVKVQQGYPPKAVLRPQWGDCRLRLVHPNKIVSIDRYYERRPKRMPVTPYERNLLEQRRACVHALLSAKGVAPRAAVLSDDGHTFELQIPTEKLNRFEKLLRGIDATQKNHPQKR
jgi:hypothetical protein